MQDDDFGTYHVYNRGVDKRSIFMDDIDRKNMINKIEKYRFNKNGEKEVDLLCYCLMDNHYHLLIQPCVQGGMSKYMHRIGTGYTNYFNTRNWRRSGALFETTYKSRQVVDDSHFWHLYRYIHLNPLKFLSRSWKAGMNDIEHAVEFVKGYQWSSFHILFNQDSYLLKNRVFLSEFKKPDDFIYFLIDWICFGVPKRQLLV